MRKAPSQGVGKEHPEGAMHIVKVLVRNYRCLRDALVSLHPQMNILVGNNECGKSTLLEAINLALTGQLNGRYLQGELHPHLFNLAAINEYIANLKAGKGMQPPSILIELYFAEHPDLAKLVGENNTLKEDTPGVRLSIEFNPEFANEYVEYIKAPDLIKTVPIEYYNFVWRSFADNDITTSRSIAIKPSLIDASALRNNMAASRFILDIVRDSLNNKQRVDLALSYRKMKDSFLDDAKVKAINQNLLSKKGRISDKTLTLSLDTTSRASWESGIVPHLDDIPMPLVGKGEQNSVKIKLAMDTSAESHLILIEEAESHLSFSSLSALIKHISENRGARQLIITTHNSYVLNKLGLDSVLFFNNGKTITLNDLASDTRDYFLKLPGHDTLRLILSKRAILVEGPSDELIVQRAFSKKFGKMPLEMGVDVITVNSLAFRRFLEIADQLDLEVDIVTDNDGDLDALQKKYEIFKGKPKLRIQYDPDISFKTLEPQLLKANSRSTLNNILGTNHATDDALLDYMGKNKTECALKFFETEVPWTVPEYIARAVGE
jgi:putative ATP-dependent endonuclease of the OLD family